MSESEPTARSPKQRDPATRVILGALVGAIAPALLGFVFFVAFNYPLEHSAPPLSISYYPPIVFAVLLIVALGWALRAFFRVPRRWFALGVLLGLAVMSLIEGGCFTLPR